MDQSVKADILKELFNISLSKAADSLSFFIQNKIFISDLKMSTETDENRKVELCEQIEEAEVVLETLLKGDYTGKSYLLFSEQDVKNFFSVAHPLNPNAQLEDEFSKEFLLEVDNIITASVVTELSNILNITLYGDVPKLIENTDELKQSLSPELKDTRCLKVVATYHSDGLVIKPQFIWFVNPGLYERIEEFVAVEENLITVQKLLSSTSA